MPKPVKDAKFRVSTTGALELRRRTRGGVAHVPCSNACRSTGAGGGSREATHDAYIIGWPAGHLCDPCSKAWRAMWAEHSAPRTDELQEAA